MMFVGYFKACLVRGRRDGAFCSSIVFCMLLIHSSYFFLYNSSLDSSIEFFNSESMKYYTEFQCEFHPFVHVSATPDAVVPIVSVSGTSSGTSSAPTRIKRKQERQVSHQQPPNIEPKTNKTERNINSCQFDDASKQTNKQQTK